MNKTYRTVWSDARQSHVVAHEKAATCGKPSSIRNRIAVALLLTACGGITTAEASVIGLPAPAGGATAAYGVSADGTAVVGQIAGNRHAFRWMNGTMADLGTLGGSESLAIGVSSNGAVVVGKSTIVGGVTRHAFRWEGGTMSDLGSLGGSDSQAYGVSADGAVVVGNSATVGDVAAHAFRWVGGTMNDLGTLGGTTSWATGVSADGAVVVGTSETTGDVAEHAYRWVGGTMSDLGTLGGTDSAARGVSADGAVVVGDSTIVGGVARHAFRWVGGTMSDLGTLGGANSFAIGASADGAVVVGASETPSAASHAFRWTQIAGMQGVDRWLSGTGVNVNGWTFSVAMGTNRDGSVVVGWGQFNGGFNQAFVARAGTGVVGLADLQQSLYQTISLPSQAVQLTSLIQNGAHHRTLMDMPMADKKQCAWASGDMGRVDRNGHGYIGITEAGVCRDMVDRQVRIGAGIGYGHTDLDLAYGGHGRMNGEYLLGEVDWAIPDTSLVASALGTYGLWDANLKRGYASAGTGTSSGNTVVEDASLRLRVDWKDAFAVKEVSFTPSLAYTENHTTVNKYSETGGNAPASFGERTHTAKELRATLAGVYKLNERTHLRGTVEAVHRFDSESGSIAVSNVMGVMMIGTTLRGSRVRQDWTRVGAEVDHRLTDSSLLSFSGNVASAGQDADITLAVSYKRAF